MKVTLNIENDQELRAHIKDAIKGQVMAIVREELLATIKEELERKVKGISSQNWDYLVKDALKDNVKDIIRNEMNVSQWSDNWIKPIVSSLISPLIIGKDWNKMIDDLAKEKVKSLLK